jgi:hypothetical protein
VQLALSLSAEPESLVLVYTFLYMRIDTHRTAQQNFPVTSYVKICYKQ